MNRLFLSITCMAALLTISSCRENIVVGGGASKSEARSTSGYYNSIEIDAPVDADVQVTEGAVPSLQLSGYANVLANIKTEIKDSTLRLYVPEMTELHTEKNAVAHIVMPAMAGISISGASDVAVHGNITGNEMDLDISGAGNVTLQALNVNEFSADMSGSTHLNIQSGIVQKATYDVSGSGSIRAFGLQANTVSLELSGAGSGEVTAMQKLDVDLSGAGHISYKGHPAITQDISGVGTVTDAN